MPSVFLKQKLEIERLNKQLKEEQKKTKAAENKSEIGIFALVLLLVVAIIAICAVCERNGILEDKITSVMSYSKDINSYCNKYK